MDTKKDPTELGAAKTILRRDLLTGSALVLVGSVAGCTKTTPPSDSTAASAAAPNPASNAAAATASSAGCGKLHTQFMDDFTARFIGPTTMPAPCDSTDWPNPRLWPDPTAKPPVDVAEKQFEMFVSLLMTFGYIDGPPPPKPSDPLAGSVWQFLTDQKWPDGIPNTSSYSKPTVTKVEIAVILDRLLQALNTYAVAGKGSSGGGPGIWPPH
jgi:hypothetical protein